MARVIDRLEVVIVAVEASSGEIGEPAIDMTFRAIDRLVSA